MWGYGAGSGGQISELGVGARAVCVVVASLLSGAGTVVATTAPNAAPAVKNSWRTNGRFRPRMIFGANKKTSQHYLEWTLSLDMSCPRVAGTRRELIDS